MGVKNITEAEYNDAIKTGKVIVDFWERKFDVLVSTTIIETGLDIATRTASSWSSSWG